MSEITIIKGSIEITADRKDLIEVVETYDGVAFNFKEGLQIYQIDTSMPNHVKNRMSNSADAFEKGKLIFNLNDYKVPVKVDVT